MGACFSSATRPDESLKQGPDSPKRLAQETHFSVDEIYALDELFKDVSNRMHKDGLMHRDEFELALFRSNQGSLFAEKVFEVFDKKKNNVIEFGEFVRALSVFHPKAPLDEKSDFAFRIYDLDNTGAIERSEVQRFLKALLKDNPAIDLDDVQIDEVIEKTFEEADLAGDGKIWPNEWQVLVHKYPSMINYMTLPVLKELTKKYPGFVFNANM